MISDALVVRKSRLCTCCANDELVKCTVRMNTAYRYITILHFAKLVHSYLYGFVQYAWFRNGPSCLCFCKIILMNNNMKKLLWNQHLVNGYILSWDRDGWWLWTLYSNSIFACFCIFFIVFLHKHVNKNLFYWRIFSYKQW